MIRDFNAEPQIPIHSGGSAPVDWPDLGQILGMFLAETEGKNQHWCGEWYVIWCHLCILQYTIHMFHIVWLTELHHYSHYRKKWNKASRYTSRSWKMATMPKASQSHVAKKVQSSVSSDFHNLHFHLPWLDKTTEISAGWTNRAEKKRPPRMRAIHLSPGFFFFFFFFFRCFLPRFCRDPNTEVRTKNCIPPESRRFRLPPGLLALTSWQVYSGSVFCCRSFCHKNWRTELFWTSLELKTMVLDYCVLFWVLRSKMLIFPLPPSIIWPVVVLSLLANLFLSACLELSSEMEDLSICQKIHLFFRGILSPTLEASQENTVMSEILDHCNLESEILVLFNKRNAYANFKRQTEKSRWPNQRWCSSSPKILIHQPPARPGRIGTTLSVAGATRDTRETKNTS